MNIDFDGISNRVARVPLGADNYFGLAVKTGHLLYVVGGAGYYGRQGDRNPSLRIYSIKDRKETTLVDDIRGYTMSGDGSKVLVAQGPGYNTAR
jgi:tricorn protease-like protein